MLQTPFGTNSIQSKHIGDNHVTCDEDEDGELTPDKHTIASMSATFSAENLIQPPQILKSDCHMKDAEEQNLEIIISDEEKQNDKSKKNKLIEISRNSSKQQQNNTFGVEFENKSVGFKNQKIQLQTPNSVITGVFGIATNQSKEQLASLSPKASLGYNNGRQVIVPRKRMTSASTLRRSSK